ncbi:nuclease-related domain-containing protein [Lysinibacillus sphaericus]
MLVKERTIPWKVLKLQALLERLSPTYPKIPLLKENLSKSLAGYNGEKSIDYYLGFLSEKEYYILHDVRLPDGERYFQIDTLIITKKFALIVEIKNLAGSIHFDTNFNQVIQTKNGVEQALPDPILQIQRQETQFKNWLKRNKLHTIPVTSVVVISNPHTLLRTNDSRLYKTIIRSDFLLHKIKQIQSSFSTNILSDSEIKKMIRKIKKDSEPLNQSILTLFNVNNEDILKGVICSNCKKLFMRRIYGTWQCPHCHQRKKDSHLDAMYQYFLLYGNEITNKQLREFIKISSPALSTRILNAVAPLSRGNNKDRVHFLNFDKKT